MKIDPEKTTELRNALIFPTAVRLLIKLFCAAFVILALVFIASPVHYDPEQNWWIARDPAIPEIPYYFLRSYIHHEPFHLLWGFEGLRRLPVCSTYILAGIVLGLMILTEFGEKANPLKAIRSAPEQRRSRRKFLTLIVSTVAALLALVIFDVFRVSYQINETFGDGYGLVSMVVDKDKYGSEALTFSAFQFVLTIGKRLSIVNPGYFAITVVSFLAGVIFVFSLTYLLLGLSRSFAERASLFIALIAGGFAVQFFGYVETTALELGLIAAYFSVAAQVLSSSARTHRCTWLLLAIFLQGLILITHPAGLLLLPSLLFLILSDDEIEASSSLLKRAAKTLIRPQMILALLTLIVLPYFLAVVIPAHLTGNMGNALGGGDLIPFVVLRNVDYADRTLSPYINYDMFSFWHLTDIFSALIISTPASLVLLPAGAYLYHRNRNEMPKSERDLSAFLGLSAIVCLLIPILWNHDYGMWGDWNLASTFLFPLNVFTWILFILASRPYIRNFRYWLGIILPLLFIQVIGFFGIYLQLW